MNRDIDELLKKVLKGENERFFLIAGPCAIEGKDMAFEIADNLVSITKRLNIPLIYKGSYKKANRSRLDSFTGIGDEKALVILRDIGREFRIPTLTDIHSAEEADMAARYVDILQIPAFLCRQTELLVAAAKTGKIVNIKKGQFLKPEAMRFAVDKVRLSRNNKVMVTDRGTMFGYGDLIVDFRAIPTLKRLDAPVVMDCTHSLQQPNTESGVTGGKPELIETIAKAAIAVGADGLFIETHPRPDLALSDGANMLKLEELQPLLEKLIRIHSAIRGCE